MKQLGWRRRCDQLGAQHEEISNLTAPCLGRIAPRLARDEVGDAPVGIDQLHLRATLQFVALGFQFTPRKAGILRADQSVALGDKRPHSEHATLHARLDDPDDARAFAVDRRQHRTLFSVVNGTCRLNSAGYWRIDAVLLQLVERASNFTPERTCRAGFHFDEHLDRATIRDAAESARDCSVRDPGLVFELAKFRYRVCRRDSRVEARLEQLRVVRIRFPRNTHLNAVCEVVGAYARGSRSVKFFTPGRTRSM